MDSCTPSRKPQLYISSTDTKFLNHIRNVLLIPSPSTNTKLMCQNTQLALHTLKS